MDSVFDPESVDHCSDFFTAQSINSKTNDSPNMLSPIGSDYLLQQSKNKQVFSFSHLGPNTNPFHEDELIRLIKIHGYDWNEISPMISTTNQHSALQLFIRLKPNADIQLEPPSNAREQFAHSFTPSKLVISKSLNHNLPSRISQMDKLH